MGIIELLASGDLELQIQSISVRSVVIATLLIGLGTIIALINKNRNQKLKLPLFIMIAGSMVVSTLILFGGTIYLNMRSESGGPVHWHADIEFWACGTEFELRDPTGFLSNKIGTSTYHEHNDKRIHLEGVVVKKDEDASLRKFMQVIGGYIQDDSVAIPLNEDQSEWFAAEEEIDGDSQGILTANEISKFIKRSADGRVAELTNTMTCSGQTAKLQVFVFRYDDESKTYYQTKLENPGEYTIRDKSVVPPGDCIIVEFDTPKNRTDKLCQQYGVRDSVRCTEFGVKGHNPELCNLREIDAPGGNQ